MLAVADVNAESASPAGLFDLSGRVAVVTGSGRGLGKAMARGLAGAGASVVICSRTGSEAQETAAELAAGGHTAVATTVDTADRASCVVGNLKHSLQVAGVDVDAIEFLSLGGKTGDTPRQALEILL